jgi:hypothetical protein
VDDSGNVGAPASDDWKVKKKKRRRGERRPGRSD